MKKSYAFIAVFSVIIICYAIAKDRMSFTELYYTYNDRYDSFDKAFSKELKDEIWMVLSNPGTINYYRPRFSKNWIFWDDHASKDSIGIMGNFLNINNWAYVAKTLPEKVKYIAVDFNDLVSHPKRNSVIVAANKVLADGGMFCIEDVYDNKEQRFEHFTQQDFDRLSLMYDIKFTYWDGYVSALPYTCDQGANGRSEIYRGIEAMILRLLSLPKLSRGDILPYMTVRLYRKIFTTKTAFIEKLVRDITTDSSLYATIRYYESVLQEASTKKEYIKKIDEEIKLLQRDVERYEKISKFTTGLTNRFKSVTNTTSKIAQKVNRLSGHNMDNNNILNRFNSFLDKSEREKPVNDILQEKKNELAKAKKHREEEEGVLERINRSLQVVEADIIKTNSNLFSKFKRDKYLESYLKYKPKTMQQIIFNNKLAYHEFWEEYDGKSWHLFQSISDLEIIAEELEKSWSPDVLLINTLTLSQLKKQSKHLSEGKTRMVIMFIKKVSESEEKESVKNSKVTKKNKKKNTVKAAEKPIKKNDTKIKDKKTKN